MWCAGVCAGGLGMRVMGLAHVGITVPRKKEGAARAFYTGVLGMVEIARPEGTEGSGGFWLGLEGTVSGSREAGDGESSEFQKVYVGFEEKKHELKFGKGESRTCLALGVTELGLWKMRLESAGVSASSAERFGSGAALEFRDPFGNLIVLVEAGTGTGAGTGAGDRGALAIGGERVVG